MALQPGQQAAFRSPVSPPSQADQILDRQHPNHVHAHPGPVCLLCLWLYRRHVMVSSNEVTHIVPTSEGMPSLMPSFEDAGPWDCFRRSSWSFATMANWEIVQGICKLLTIYSAVLFALTPAPSSPSSPQFIPVPWESSSFPFLGMESCSSHETTLNFNTNVTVTSASYDIYATWCSLVGPPV